MYIYITGEGGGGGIAAYLELTQNYSGGDSVYSASYRLPLSPNGTSSTSPHTACGKSNKSDMRAEVYLKAFPVSNATDTASNQQKSRILTTNYTVHIIMYRIDDRNGINEM